jgi:hypothetical protein
MTYLDKLLIDPGANPLSQKNRLSLLRSRGSIFSMAIAAALLNLGPKVSKSYLGVMTAIADNFYRGTAIRIRARQAKPFRLQKLANLVKRQSPVLSMPSRLAVITTVVPRLSRLIPGFILNLPFMTHRTTDRHRLPGYSERGNDRPSLPLKVGVNVLLLALPAFDVSLLPVFVSPNVNMAAIAPKRQRFINILVLAEQGKTMLSQFCQSRITATVKTSLSLFRADRTTYQTRTVHAVDHISPACFKLVPVCTNDSQWSGLTRPLARHGGAYGGKPFLSLFTPGFLSLC